MTNVYKGAGSNLEEGCMLEEMFKTRGEARRVLQVALYHDKLDGIKAGLRMFPSSHLILLYHISPQTSTRVSLYVGIR